MESPVRCNVGSSRDQLLAEIAAEEARLRALEGERAAARARLEALRQQLHTDPLIMVQGLPSSGSTVAPTTAMEKVKLFQSLFRGRADVFPTRFVSTKTGKAGYAPACSNKFVRGVCELPRVKCGECPNQAFLRSSEQAVLDHLRGRHVMGVYPLLTDETCWFLAVDFDGAGWKDDMAAFVETCRSAKIPVAVERSRSGNGAHAWFFFAGPLPASVARAMGSYLITETMARRHQLRMQSYDRLFPNQDTLPRGGFGNLIALPLQYEPRKQGNSVFVDESFEAHSDQWAFLAATHRMSPAEVEAIARDAARHGQVVGVRFSAPTDDDSDTPWTRLPSGRPQRTPIPGPLPRDVHAVLAQRLFVDKTGLPSPLLNQIKRLAAFQNPEFYKKQQMRLSTAMTPRVITCAEDLAQHISLPRGCLGDLNGLLGEHGVNLIIDDRRCDGELAAFRFRGELTPLQEQAAQILLRHDTGVFVAPPGIGKTVLGTYMVAERGRSTLVLVHRRPLLDQWVAQLSGFLGIDEKEVGQIGGGKREPNGRLDVAMIQSLARKESVDDIVATYGQVVVDECHHLPAVSFERVLSEIKARYVVGLTATPHRRDGLHPIIEMHLGPTRFTIDSKAQPARHSFSRQLVVRETAFRLDGTATDTGIQEIYRALAECEARNRMILDDVAEAVAAGRSPILLTERRDHLEYFAERLGGLVPNLIVLQGGRTQKDRREISAKLAAVPDGEKRLVLATGRYIGEGFDEARLDTLFLALPVSWKGTLVQYTGRLHRPHPGKTRVSIFDYVDREVPVLKRMFDKRMRTYRAIGYIRDEGRLDLLPMVEALEIA